MKWMKRSLGLLVLVVIGWAVYILHLAGTFRPVEPMVAADCRMVPGAIGAEDITLHPGGRWAYLSSADRRTFLAGGDPGPGAIYRYDLKATTAVPEAMILEPAIPFQPHGISLYRDEAGNETLFVINHANWQHSIEVFAVQGRRLIHQRTLTDPALVSPNDIVAIDASHAYVTNDHGFSDPDWQMLEDYLRLPMASVVWVGEDTARQVLDGLFYANGIQLSPDGRQLYVATTTEPALRIYDRDTGDQSLTLDRTISLAMGPDNIELDQEGDLWIAGHPRLLAFTAHARDEKSLSPSEVVEIELDTASGDRVTTRYREDGVKLSGSSVSAVAGERALIGSVFEPHFLDCRLKPVSETAGVE